jgi:hypothetical protein
MTMTNSESQWIARVMRTINHVAFMVPCNTMARPLQKGAGEDVLRAAQTFIQVLKLGDTDGGKSRPLEALGGSGRGGMDS